MLDVKRVDDLQFLQLRNPWGSFEWKGDWSDNSDMWKKHPKVKAALHPDTEVGESDGIFWISWGDFRTYFSSIDACKRTTGLGVRVLWCCARIVCM